MSLRYLFINSIFCVCSVGSLSGREIDRGGESVWVSHLTKYRAIWLETTCKIEYKFGRMVIDFHFIIVQSSVRRALLISVSSTRFTFHVPTPSLLSLPGKRIWNELRWTRAMAWVMKDTFAARRRCDWEKFVANTESPASITNRFDSAAPCVSTPFYVPLVHHSDTTDGQMPNVKVHFAANTNDCSQSSNTYNSRKDA